MQSDDGVPSDRRGDELFDLAERAAELLGGPVTIEDTASRVQAYSLHDDGMDAARTRTIVSRQVPEEVVAHFRARGVFRRLAVSDAPLPVPGGPGGIRPRLAVPVRLGGEWLGSVWAVREDPVDDGVLAELRPVVRRIGLHLLRLRAQVDVERRELGAHLQAVLRPQDDVPPRPGSGRGPWRAVAFVGPAELTAVDDAPRRLDVWDAVLRRSRWWLPQLTVIDGVVVGVVGDPVDAHAAARPGSWPWLARAVEQLHGEEPGLAVAAGAPVELWSDLPRSRTQAVELAGIVADADGAPAARTYEEHWVEVVVHRAVAAVAEVARISGPLAVLADHDRRRGSQHVATLVAALDHPGDPRAAAAVLHVHPNTFRYRMRRITELALAEVDLTDPRTRLALRLQAEALGPDPATR